MTTRQLPDFFGYLYVYIFCYTSSKSPLIISFTRCFPASHSSRASLSRRSSLISPTFAATGAFTSCKKTPNMDHRRWSMGTMTSLLLCGVCALQGQTGFCVSRCRCWSGRCLRRTNRGHSLQPGGRLLFLESSSNVESGATASSTLAL